MSTAIMGIIMTGLASSIFVTSRAIPVGNNAASVTVNSGRALSDLESDLASAKTVTVSTPTAFEFTVSDRTGDNIDDTIRYEWSGTAGAALTRRINNGAVTTIQSNVSNFSLAYFNRMVVTMTDQATVATIGPQVLASFASYPSGSPVTQDFSIAASGSNGSTVGWAGEYFYLASIPQNVTKIQFTQARVWLKSSTGSTVDPTIAIHTAIGGSNFDPQTVIGTPATIARGSLTAAYTQVSVNFPANVFTTTISPNFVLLLKGSSTTRSAYLQNLYLNKKAPSDSSVMQWSTNSGSSWMPASGDIDKYDVPFEVWGSYETTTISPVPISTYFLQSVDVTLVAGAAPASRLDITALVPNEPQMAGP